MTCVFFFYILHARTLVLGSISLNNQPTNLPRFFKKNSSNLIVVVQRTLYSKPWRKITTPYIFIANKSPIEFTSYFLILPGNHQLISELFTLYGSFPPNNLLPTVRSDCKKIGCGTHCFQWSETSPIGQSGANLFKNYLV